MCESSESAWPLSRPPGLAVISTDGGTIDGDSASLDPPRNKRRSSPGDWLAEPPNPHLATKRSRRRILEALSEADEPELRARAEKIRRCRTETLIGRNEAGLPVLLQPRCRNRLCPSCQRDRSRELAEAVSKAIRGADAVRMMTLTVRSSDDPLRVQLRELMEAFKRLRSSDRWSLRVRGGVYCVEVTFNVKTRQYHPHLHLLIEGDYYPHELLKAGWEVASGGSSVVWISGVQSRVQASRYIASYVAKSSDVESWPGEIVRDWALQTVGFRFCGTFGSYRGRPLVRDDDEPEAKTREVLCTAADFRYALSLELEAAVHAHAELSRFAPSWLRRMGIVPLIIPTEEPDAGDWEDVAAALAEIPRVLGVQGESPPSSATD